jgi:lipopolysaccharide transport system ATP-binding protein
MSDTVIRVENLGKRYRIGLKEKSSKSLRGKARDVFTSPFKYLNTVIREPSPDEVFWALKDVSFEVKRGEVLGIIGRNGAGKSTLLKILSRITEPTKGFVEIRGRVGSLLEVGTGFHPDLTGRENTYLNGTIMGMKKREIDRRFDEIVAFAEVEKFIDTPVKHYSSGMYTRLAFAVAAHLTPETLIVDEVLAVGDSQFQKKCFAKMDDVSKEGRTIIFVSHNLASITTLCTRAIFLKNGRYLGDDVPQKMIAKYLAREDNATGEIISLENPKPNQKLKLKKISLTRNSGIIGDVFDCEEDVFLNIYLEILKPNKGYTVAFQVHHVEYGCVFSSAFYDSEPLELLDRYWEVGDYKLVVKLPTKVMRDGEYWIKVASAIPKMELLDVMDRELSFNLQDSNSPVAQTQEGRIGVILPILKWDIDKH